MSEAMRHGAEQALRDGIRDALMQAELDADGEIGATLDDQVEAVLARLAERRLSPALAYLAGVTMAPDLMRAAAAPHPP